MAVAMNTRSDYFTAFVNLWVRQAASLDHAGLVELGAAVTFAIYDAWQAR